jgi:hypothetical protein
MLITPERCRDRAAECHQMAERAPNMRVQDILLDIARTWTRLALEVEQWSSANRPALRLKKASKDRLTALSVPRFRRGSFCGDPPPPKDYPS